MEFTRFEQSLRPHDATASNHPGEDPGSAVDYQTPGNAVSGF
jgi:hypothetical protein